MDQPTLHLHPFTYVALFFLFVLLYCNYHARKQNQNQNSKKDYNFPKLTWPQEHYPSIEAKFNANYYTNVPSTDKDQYIELKRQRQSPPSTRIFSNEPLLRETNSAYPQQHHFEVPQKMIVENSRYDIFNPKSSQNYHQYPKNPLQSSLVVDMRNARMSDNNFQVKYNNRQMNPNLFDINSTQDEIEVQNLMPSLNSKAYKDLNVIQHQHHDHQHDYLSQIRQPNVIKEKEGVLGSFNFKQQMGGEYVITQFQRRNEPEMYREKDERIMMIPNSQKAAEINRIPQAPLIMITPTDDLPIKQETLRVHQDSLQKKRKRDEFESFPFAASTEDMKNQKLVKITPKENGENVQPNLPKQGFQFKNPPQHQQQMSYLIPPKKNTLGRNIQINLGKKVPSLNMNSNKPLEVHLSPKSPKNVKKIVSNTKKSKDSDAVDTRFDRFVYSRKKVPRTREEGELQNLSNQADIRKKPLLTSQIIHPQKLIVTETLQESPKLLSESSTITGSFLTPKSAKFPSEDINESLKALVENSQLSTIRPIKVQKIEVIQKEETPGHKFVNARVEIEYRKSNSDEKDIFANANLKTDVSFSELNQTTNESEDGRLSEMIETLVNKKDSL